MKLKCLVPALLLAGICAPISVDRATGEVRIEKSSFLKAREANEEPSDSDDEVLFSEEEIASGGDQTLRILNMEDYIYMQDDKDPESAKDLIYQFQDYAREKGFENAQVVYNTTDTNESLYSSLRLGKAYYDVLCPSDYMIQKLMNDNLAYKLTDEDKKLIPNYFGGESKASTRIKGTLDAITATNGEKMEDYAVGYMWGTLGLLFNPSYKTFQNREYDEEKVIKDMMSWNSLWGNDYKNAFSIKDSMRDTYAVGVLHTYDDLLTEARETYDADVAAAKENALDIYQNTISGIFNRSEQKYVDEVANNLKTLKNNSFGLECDSGKEDIVTGKIGINIAWSGDACYSIEQACDLEKVAEETTLLYSIPENGSNIWFDAWCIPNTSRSENQKRLALLWLDFVSDPENAAQNMEYTGYTPFTAGDSMIEIARDWYDYRTGYLYKELDNGEEADVCYLNDEDETVAIDYSDFLATPLTTDKELFIITDDGMKPVYDGEGEVLFEDELKEDFEAEPLTYNSLHDLLDDIEEVDLSYFFEGTLTEYEDEDMIFYSDDYLPFEYEDEDGNMQKNICVGGEFFCQYPNMETINRCSVMKDYGPNNKIIMKMWENFKSESLPLWAIILFACEGCAIVTGVAIYVVKKQTKLSIRHKRKNLVK